MVAVSGGRTSIDVQQQSAMDEHEMTSGVIPLRHASLPGHIKLPRRYEKAAMGTNGIPLHVRKISIQGGHKALGDSLSDRLDDLTAAILWIKQELIMLRQHDILLKRQFIDIQHSIRSLRKTPATSPTTTSTTTTTMVNTTATDTPVPTILLNGTAIVQEKDTFPSAQTNGTNLNKNMDFVTNCDGQFLLNTYVTVRPSSSVTLLHEVTSEEEDEEGEGLLREGAGEGRDQLGLFCEFYRPRSSSMRTSRDMAALARRRGSKELI